MAERVPSVQEYMYASFKMQVPLHTRGGFPNRRRTAPSGVKWLRGCLALTLAASCAYAAPKPQPAIRLPLANLGIPNVPQYLQGAGASMLGVQFVDTTHILVTSSLRGLVERIAGDPPSDQDRAVAALLVELPSGKVLARTRWHLHDYSQYLWNLGDGRFLVRSRGNFTTIAPLANLSAEDPFRATPFLHVSGNLDGLQVSPDGALVTFITSPHKRRQDPATVLAATAPGSPPPDVPMEDPREPKPPSTFYFVRVAGAGTPDSPIKAISAGSVKASGGGFVPLNGRGYLFAKGEKRSRWAMQFDSFDGQVRKLSYVDSSCSPRMQFVSPTQFLVFSCRGSDDKVMLSAFDFMPQEMWEEPLSGVSPFAQFAFAPQAGRFAFSRSVSMSSVAGGVGAPASSVTSDELTGQEVRVYQMQSGDLILKLVCTPISRSGENFDLSSDGLNLLVVRQNVIEVYRLPPPSERDRKELAELKPREPPVPATLNVRFPHLLKEAVENAVEADAEAVTAERSETPAQARSETPAHAAQTPPPAPPASPRPAAPPAATSAAANAGDVDTTRRAPPTLLNPGENSENKQPKK